VRVPLVSFFLPLFLSSSLSPVSPPLSLSLTASLRPFPRSMRPRSRRGPPTSQVRGPPRSPSLFLSPLLSLPSLPPSLSLSHGFIETFPQKYETEVTEETTNLSGAGPSSLSLSFSLSLTLSSLSLSLSLSHTASSRPSPRSMRPRLRRALPTSQVRVALRPSLSPFSLSLSLSPSLSLLHRSLSPEV
jgi:hypothetical protein